MLRLIFRQILKHKYPLLAVMLVWVVGGYYIFSIRHDLLSFVYRMASDHPIGTEQHPERAYFDYLRPALERIEKNEIRLATMKRACLRTGVSHPSLEEFYRPHWLENINAWAEESGIRNNLMAIPEADEYWIKHRNDVSNSLMEAVEALSHSYEIPPGTIDENQRNTILIPAIVQDLAEALCDNRIGIFAWGDYISFLEARAYRQVVQTMPDFETMYPFPSEQDVFTLERLRGNRNYITALENYVAGGVPERPSMCVSMTFRLVCAAPQEAIRIYNRRLYYSSMEDQRAGLHLNFGKLYRFLAAENRDYLNNALEQFTGATRRAHTEQEARKAIIRIYLERQETEKAYTELRQLSLTYTERGLENREFRNLARTTLIQLGRFRDADCYSEMANYPSITPFCRNLRL